MDSSAPPTKLRLLLFSLPTETVLLQILLLPSPPSSSSSLYTIPTVPFSPQSPLDLYEQCLASIRTLLARPSATLLPVDFFLSGQKQSDSLLPFAITTEGDGERIAWWVGLVPPSAKEEGGLGEWFGRPEAVKRVGDGERGDLVKRAVGLVRGKTDAFYL